MDIKEKLALSCRILGTSGHNDLDLGHVSARESGQSVVYIKPHTLCLDEVQPEDIITLDFNYKILSGSLPMHSEAPIHVEIYKQRPDVNCVVHTHPVYATALSSTGARLRPISHEGVLFAKELPLFDLTTNLVVTEELGRALAKTLGGARAALMMGHGIVVVGETIEQACVRAYSLEKAAYMQFVASVLGELRWVSEDEAEMKAERIYRNEKLNRMWYTMVKRLKKIESA